MPADVMQRIKEAKADLEKAACENDKAALDAAFARIYAISVRMNEAAHALASALWASKTAPAKWRAGYAKKARIAARQFDNAAAVYCR